MATTTADTQLTPVHHLPVDFNSFAGTRAVIISPTLGNVEVQDDGRGVRSFERRFVLKDKQGKHYEETTNAVLSVNVHHDKDRKHFRVSINRLTVSPTMYRMAFTFGQGQPVKDWAIPCERYSTKRHLEAFHQAMVEIDPNLTELLDWAAGAIKENED
jgi:hypothetical protein